MPSHPPQPHIIDVRQLMADGEHPVPALLQSLEKLPPGHSVILLTPFLPSPLIATLQSEGFAARPERQADGSWQTQFLRR